ncbi:patatin-like phospholipase family protein [Pseudobdellovibrio sp. HCB154]|uniref:patatin-like phospholipase family protein n=1 Tax=Pseudobdellovibrio sp. HCB154 TaxID=3386277 RepID=UPI00391734BA
MIKADLLHSKPFTLSLSSGFFGFFAHTGFIKALEEKSLKPRMVVGSSAGALVAACTASGLTASEMAKEFTAIKKSDFWDVGFGFGLVRGDKMERMFEQFMAPNFASLKIPLQISAFDIFALKTKTLQSGSVAKAARASCAVPGLFHPVRIDKRVYLDGGVADKMGLSGVDRDEFVLAHSLGTTNGFESPRVNRKHFSKLLQFELKDIPRSGPDRLHVGGEIITESYRQSKLWLEAPVENLALLPAMAHSENSKHNNNLTL